MNNTYRTNEQRKDALKITAIDIYHRKTDRDKD